ncbi:hypothetical protein I552_3964 [Mycobacterium xenopi 3993]|nr:hypothetical protein I552_3964 [Mycobacterium xenopi 3993]
MKQQVTFGDRVGPKGPYRDTARARNLFEYECYPNDEEGSCSPKSNTWALSGPPLPASGG